MQKANWPGRGGPKVRCGLLYACLPVLCQPLAPCALRTPGTAANVKALHVHVEPMCLLMCVAGRAASQAG